MAPKLREKGFDAVSTPEANRPGESDDSQPEWAAQEGRVNVTFNVAHFARLHHERLAGARHQADTIVSSQRPIGDLLRRILALASALTAEAMQDRLGHVSDW